MCVRACSSKEKSSKKDRKEKTSKSANSGAGGGSTPPLKSSKSPPPVTVGPISKKGGIGMDAGESSIDQVWLFRPFYCRVLQTLQPFWKGINIHAAVALFDSHCVSYRSAGKFLQNPGKFTHGLRPQEWVKAFQHLLT